MRKLFLTIAMMLFTAAPALASHEAGHPAVDKIAVSVNGLVCDFCARTLEKVFYKRDGVEGVNVNLDDKIVTLEVAKGTELSDEEITKLITDSGYNVTKISRGEE